MARSRERVLSQDMEQLQAYFAGMEEVALAYLFGSYARGELGPLSDIDIAVLLSGEPDDAHCLDLRMDISDDLGRLLRSEDVDVVILNQAPLGLCYRVLRDGLLLFCRDEDMRIIFTARAVSEYLDFKPFIERHERAIIERARKGELLHGHNPYRGALERYRRLRRRSEGTEQAEL